MPPIRKVQKEDIIKVAYEIVKEEGFKALNSRRIAKELNCSVQPIFHNFTSMEELEKKVYEQIYLKYKEYMTKDSSSDKAYKKMGLSYIQFAKDYPEFFKVLFMKRTSLEAKDFIMADAIGDDVIKAGQKLSHLSYEEQKEFHVKVWIFTHGIACLVATNTVEFSIPELDRLLEQTVREMLIGYKKK